MVMNVSFGDVGNVVISLQVQRVLRSIEADVRK